jgi:hypothetical protein
MFGFRRAVAGLCSHDGDEAGMRNTRGVDEIHTRQAGVSLAEGARTRAIR